MIREDKEMHSSLNYEYVVFVARYLFVSTGVPNGAALQNRKRP